MKLLLAILSALFAGVTVAAAAPEVIQGCQGEGCECFQAYRSAGATTGANRPEIVAIRPFTLFKDRSLASPVLGKFAPGVKARPLRQEIVVDAAGRYIVEQTAGGATSLKKGDALDTIISEGEGFYRARRNGQWVDFEAQTVKLKVVKKTAISAWMSVSVNGLVGFTPDHPFEKCLE
jgi:hypothetical protein